MLGAGVTLHRSSRNGTGFGYSGEQVDQPIQNEHDALRLLPAEMATNVLALHRERQGLVAAGPGTTDAITGVANGWYEESAMDAAKAGVEP